MSNINVSSLIVPRRTRNGRIYATSNGTSSSFSTSTSLNSDGVRKHGNKGNLLLSELPLLSSITDNFNFEVQDNTVTTTSKIVASTLFDYINGKLGLADALALKLDANDSRIEEWNSAYSWGNHDGLYRPISYVPTWDEVTSKPTWISKFGWDTVNNRVTISEDLFVSGNISASEEVIAWVAGAVESDVLANLTTSYPLHKSSNSNIELLLSNQFEVNGSNQLQIKAGVLVPTSHTHTTTDITDLSTVLSTKLSTSLKGVADGLAELDANGFVKNAQLPSYVDDVLEYADFNSLPVTGESGKIYVTTNNLLTYRWGGSTYSEISQSLALGTTSTTAFRGDWGLTAYNYSQIGHLPLHSTADNSTGWNGFSNNIGGGPFGGAPSSIAGFDGTLLQRYNSDAIKSFLGLGSNAYNSNDYVLPNIGFTGSGSDMNNLYKGGFYSLYGTTNAPFGGDGGAIIIPTWAGSNSTNRYTTQIAGQLANPAETYIRSTTSDGAGTWYKLWNGANFDPNSKLQNTVNYNYGDFNSILNSGIYYSYRPINSPTGSNIEETYTLLGMYENTGAGSQIAISHYGGSKGRIFFRTLLSGYESWKEIYHTGNFNPDNYLLKSGGTLTGNLTGTGFNFSYLKESGGITYWGAGSGQGGLTWDNGGNGWAQVFSTGSAELRISSGSGTINLLNTTNVTGNLTISGSMVLSSGIGYDITWGGWSNGKATISADGYGIVMYPAGNASGGRVKSNGNLEINGNVDTSGNITASGEVTAYSDIRLKSNIKPLKLRGELKPVTYIKDNKKSIGFIAQDVKQLYPELVKGEGDEMLSLNYQQLTAVLYAEIIELKNRIKTLEKWHSQTQV